MGPAVMEMSWEGLSHHWGYPNAKGPHMHCVAPSFGA